MKIVHGPQITRKNSFALQSSGGDHRPDWPAAARNWLLNADRFKASTPGPSAGAATRLHSGGTKNYHEPL